MQGFPSDDLAPSEPDDRRAATLGHELMKVPAGDPVSSAASASVRTSVVACPGLVILRPFITNVCISLRLLPVEQIVNVICHNVHCDARPGAFVHKGFRGLRTGPE
jgi:hypothetical protein